MATSHTTPDARGRQTGDRRGTLSGAEPPTDPTTTTVTGGAAPAQPGAAARDIKTHEERRAWPDQTGTTTPTGSTTAAGTDLAPLPPELAARRARLAAMGQPRPGDSPRTAALRAMLRDDTLMAEVTANVDGWPEPTEEQRQTIAALLHRPTPHRPTAQR